MTDARKAAYELYLSAWSAVDDDERSRRLRDSLASGIVFDNATRSRHGIADVALHLQDFQSGMPGGSFKLLSMLGWEDHAMAKWQVIDADGVGGFTGYDTLVLDCDRRICSIVMFVDVEKQRLP